MICHLEVLFDNVATTFAHSIEATEEAATNSFKANNFNFKTQKVEQIDEASLMEGREYDLQGDCLCC